MKAKKLFILLGVVVWGIGCGDEKDSESGIRIHQAANYSTWNNAYVLYTTIYNGRRIVRMYEDKLPVTDSIRSARIAEARAFIDTAMTIKDTTIYIK